MNSGNNNQKSSPSASVASVVSVVKPPPVLIVVPTAGEVRDSVAAATYQMGKRYSNADVRFVRGSPIHYNRNKIGRLFLELPGVDWLLFVDSDVEPPLQALGYMMDTAAKTQAKAITAPTPIWRDGAIVFNLVGMGDQGTFWYCQMPAEPFEVEATGFGCVLLHRSLLEALPYPWWNWTESDGQEVGEDIGFCRRLRAAGHSIVCDPRVLCRHYKTMDLLQVSAWAMEAKLAREKSSDQ